MPLICLKGYLTSYQQWQAFLWQTSLDLLLLRKTNIVVIGISDINHRSVFILQIGGSVLLIYNMYIYIHRL